MTVKAQITIEVEAEIPELMVDQLKQMCDDAAWEALNNFRTHNSGCLRSATVITSERIRW